MIRCAMLSALALPPPAPLREAKARLCAACGMCCDGTMFALVMLQPGDSRKELAALGLKPKHKHGRTCFQQPCPAFRGTHCAIYAARPERCRVFECRQLRQLAAGEIAEGDALARIRAAREQVAHILGLLAERRGKTSHRHLKQRCDDALAQAAELDERPESGRRRVELADAIGALEAMLDAEFRVGAAGAVAHG